MIFVKWSTTDLSERVEFVAFGTDQWQLPIYRVTETGLERTKSFYPAILKFTEPDRLSREMNPSKKEILEKYGKILPRMGEKKVLSTRVL